MRVTRDDIVKAAITIGLMRNKPPAYGRLLPPLLKISQAFMLRTLPTISEP